MWFTPMTNVPSSFLPGAEMMTFLAPLSRCALAFVASVKKPVDSITMSAPSSPHGRFAGSRSASARMRWPLTVIDSSSSRWPTIFVSGGRRGLEAELHPQDLVRLTDAVLARIAR